MKKYIFISILFLTGGFLQAQDKPANKISWYSLEEAQEMQKQDPKPIFVDVYTDWCGWCKKMDRETFSDKEVASYMMAHFYPVKFDAESKEPVTFQGKTYTNRQKTHDLAIALLNGRLGYPSVVFINEENLLVQAVPGFKQAGDMLGMLEYYASKQYEKGISLQDFLSDKAN